MQSNIKIRKFKREDTLEVANLIRETYVKFNNDEYFEQVAVNNYLDRINIENHGLDNVYSMLSKSQFFLVAEQQNRIVGMIRGDCERIYNLFVKGDNHHQGIGSSLIAKLEKEAVKHGSTEIKIRASLYAAPFYQKLGYKKTTGIRNFRGLKIIPMKKILSLVRTDKT